MKPAIQTNRTTAGKNGDYCDGCNRFVGPYRPIVTRVPDRQFPVTLKPLAFCSAACEEAHR